MPLLIIGLNHKTASIDIREKVAVTEHAVAKVVAQLCVHETIKSCVLLSTCNRTEFYFSCDNTKLATEIFHNWHNLGADIQQYFYHKTEVECIEHLFAVAAGLDSMVLGESQILGQVKAAYEISKKANKLDKILGRLLQTTFRVAKSIRTTTDIGKNPVSVANSAVQLSQQIFGELSQQNILMIGAGATVELLLRYVHKLTYQKLAICNRTLATAQQLSKQFDAEVFALNDLKHNIAQYDLIFTATASPVPIINPAMIKPALNQRKLRPMVIIDLAIPRDVDVMVKKFNDVFYYAVDDLQKVINQNLKSRENSAISAREIIKAEALSFIYWIKGQVHTQLIHNFQKETAKIRKQSLDKALKQLNQNSISHEEVLFSLANNLTNKLNHAPVKAIRKAIQSGDMNKIDIIIELLNLDNTQIPK
ncbi:MAG: glutamyl-tRNA reductase [Proteobacteria bacterium]|nr:glutamyl-tRNA reductase [Pseudomonadota bacterium]